MPVCPAAEPECLLDLLGLSELPAVVRPWLPPLDFPALLGFLKPPGLAELLEPGSAELQELSELPAGSNSTGLSEQRPCQRKQHISVCIFASAAAV